MKYIDAEKLKEILKSQIKERKRWMKYSEKSDRQDQLWSDLNGEDMSILTIIDILQQERPEVDLDFSMFAKEMDVVFNLPKEVTKNTEENPLNWEYAIARHFYQIGSNTRKEEE